MAFLTTLLCISSCNNDENIGTVNPSGTIVLRSSIYNGNTRSVSQELQNTGFDAGRQVGVFVTGDGEDATYTGYTNVALTTDGNDGFTGQSMSYPESGSVSIIAYAPYNSQFDSSTTQAISVRQDQSTDDGYLDSDLLYATATSTISDASVDLLFYHKFTKININFIGSDISNLQGETVTIKDVYLNTIFNLEDGSMSDNTDPGDITAAVYDSDATTFTCSAIIVPQEVSGDVVFMTAGGGEYYLPKTTTFKEGTHYTYNAKVGEGAIVLELVTAIQDWSDPEEEDETYVPVIGDFMLSDGTFISGDTEPAELPAGIVGIVFSTEVSEADAAEGYAGYVLAIRDSGSHVTWFGSESVSADNLSLIDGVSHITSDNMDDIATDWDGLTNTKLFLASEAPEGSNGWGAVFSLVNDYDGTGTISNYSRDDFLVTASNCSGWYIPSLGQWALIFKNLCDMDYTVGSTSFTYDGDGVADKLHECIGAKLSVSGLYTSNADGGSFNYTDYTVQFGDFTYHTSTQYDKSDVWKAVIHSADGTTGTVSITNGTMISNYNGRVRYVLAYKLSSDSDSLVTND